MALISLNCPNCSAALRLGADDRSGKCAFCGSTFLLDSNPTDVRRGADAAVRGADAAERAASELALRRLHFEHRDVTEALQHWDFQRERAAQEDIERGHAERNERTAAALQHLKEWRSYRLGALFFTVLIAVGTKQSYVAWLIAVVGLALTVALHMRIRRLKAAVHSESQSTPVVDRPWEPPEEEKRLRARKAQVESELVRHRRVVDSTA